MPQLKKRMSRARQRGFYHRTTFTSQTKVDKNAIPSLKVFAFKVSDEYKAYTGGKLKITKFRFIVDGINELAKVLTKQ